MKKSFIILFSLLFSISYTETKAQAFQKGTTAINAGVGVGTALGGYGKLRPAISISADHGIWEVGGPGVVSLGGYVGTTGYKYSDSSYNAKWNYIIVGVRGAYHYNGFQNLPDLDLYGGAMLGYNIVKYTSDQNEDFFGKTYGSGIGLSGFLGTRYHFTEIFGVFAELGYGVSVLSAGLTFKF